MSITTLGYAGSFFAAVFLVECITRILAFGLILDPHSYLRRDTANIFDFGIVVIGALDLMPGSESSVSLGSLRLFRVLRVLRTITTFPELRALVQILLRSMPALGDVLILCMFVFIIFGILGVQLYKGVLHGRCFDVDSGSMTSDSICGGGFIQDPNEKFWIRKGMQVDFGGGMRRCEFQKSHCLPLGENPGQGSIHFDNIVNAIISIFQVIHFDNIVNAIIPFTLTTLSLTCIQFDNIVNVNASQSECNVVNVVNGPLHSL